METRCSLRCLWWLAVAALVATSPALAVKRRAFATSVQGPGNLSSWADAGGNTGLAAGDAICRARAAAGGLPNAATYRAWLSNSATDAYCHVQGLSGTVGNACLGASQPGGGPWYQANGITAFTDTLARLTGPGHVIYRNLLFDEFGQTIPLAEMQIWTGTGIVGAGTGEDCTSWGTNAGTGRTGSTYESAYHWTYAWESACTVSHRLLCLEPGASEPLALTWSPAALVFVTDPVQPRRRSEQLDGCQRRPGDRGRGRGLPDAGGRRPSAGARLVRGVALDCPDGRHLPPDDRRTLPAGGRFRRGQRTKRPRRRADPGQHSRARERRVPHQPGHCLDGQRLGRHLGGTDCGGWTSAVGGDSGHAGAPGRSREPGWTALGSDSCTASSKRLYCFSNVITIFWDGFDATGDTGRWSSTTP